MTAELVPTTGEGHKSQIHAVEHQLNRHKDSDDVALEQERKRAQTEQNRAQDQIPGQGDHQFSFLPSTTAPMMAIRISTEVTSNGSRNLLKRRRATLCVSPKFEGPIATLPSSGVLRTSVQVIRPATMASAGPPRTMAI